MEHTPEPNPRNATDSGKQLRYVVRIEQLRKERIDVVTDDGTTYTFSRFTPEEPWTHERTMRPDGSFSTLSRLPQNVESYIDRRNPSIDRPTNAETEEVRWSDYRKRDVSSFPHTVSTTGNESGE